MLAKVSTLLIMVGLPHSPACVGKGGRGRGWPRCPMMLAIRAVSSPHTKAPAPTRISTSKSNPLPNRFCPRNPNSRACFSATFSRWMARGYSART